MRHQKIAFRCTYFLIKSIILCDYTHYIEHRSQEKKGGGSLILDWMYARGGGVIQMRTECNRGGGGV